MQVRKKKYQLSEADEKALIRQYNGYNGPELARSFGITAYFLDVIKKKHGLVRKGYRHPKRPDFNIDVYRIPRTIEMGRNGIFNVHAVENWVA